METNEETKKSEKKTVYELGYILRLDSDKSSIKEVLEKIGAKVLAHADLKTISLAYPIKKQEKAEFGFCHFETEVENPKLEIENVLKFKDEVLRSILVKLPEEKEKKAPRKSAKPEKNKETSKDDKEPIQSLESISNETLEEKLEELVK